MVRVARLALLASAVLVTGACSTAGAGAPQLPSRSAAPPTAAGTTVSATPSPPSRPSTPSSCPVTIPDASFVPPPPFAARPPAEDHELWYGSPDLWAALSTAGEIWWVLPSDQSGFSQKTFWYSKDFSVMNEPQPAIAVTGRRLDGNGPTVSAGAPGTNAIDASGESMLVGIVVPTTGCWEISAQYRGHTLHYVVWVAD